MVEEGSSLFTTSKKYGHINTAHSFLSIQDISIICFPSMNLFQMKQQFEATEAIQTNI